MSEEIIVTQTQTDSGNVAPMPLSGPLSGDDIVVPFQVDGLDVRGRTVQLGAALDTILKRHNYPEAVAQLLGEATVLTVLLGTSLKFDGKFIFQTKSDGPVDMLVVDFRTPDAIRAYARFDEARVAEFVAAGKTKPEELLGQGTLALTVDQGEFTQRYQGIVALDGSSLEDIARNYFMQSEQIATDVQLAVAKLLERGEDGKPVEQWRAGGLLVQFLPQSELRARHQDISGGDHPDSAVSLEVASADEWQEARSLMATVQDAELTDPQVPSERLLYRLFHERGVRVYEGTKVLDKCACSRDRIFDVLKGFSAEEIQDSTEEDKISVTCEFCSTRYDFEPAEIIAAQAE